MTAFVRIRRFSNLLNLSTPLGVLLAAITGTPLRKGTRGLIFGTDYRPLFPQARAFTVGNVIFFRATEPELALLDHEARHSTQYMLCLGLPFFPLYFAGAAWSWWRTGDPGSRNPFERWAGLTEGGYRERETLPRLRGWWQKSTMMKRFSQWKRTIPSR
ncbi:hypothetical protein [Psychromicrobium sp. YIM B11713]|uniref:hypothetical protein n=1 Tax=Psychromicrobium sp. YIM B11713 TaxID=3145233 RepID=UPI00374EBF7E